MIVQRVFQILAEHPRGLSSNDLWDELTNSLHAPKGNGNGNGNGVLSSFGSGSAASSKRALENKQVGRNSYRFNHPAT